MTFARRIAGALILLVVWQALSGFGLLNAALFPAPSEVIVSLAQLCGPRSIGADLLATINRLVLSMLWAACIAIPAGLVMGAVERIEEYCGGIVDFFRSLPATAMFPVFMLFFGLGETAKIGVTAFSAGLVLLVGTAHGVRQIRPLRREAAEACGARNGRLFFHVILPAAAPEISIALRTAVSIALIIVIVTEMFAGTSSGLGWRIYAARESFRVPELYALLVITGSIGAAISGILKHLESRFIHWSGQ